MFERGLTAIPLSVDLWIHYLNYCKATYPDDEEFLRKQFQKALDACGLEFRYEYNLMNNDYVLAVYNFTLKIILNY